MIEKKLEEMNKNIKELKQMVKDWEEENKRFDRFNYLLNLDNPTEKEIQELYKLDEEL